MKLKEKDHRKLSLERSVHIRKGRHSDMLSLCDPRQWSVSALLFSPAFKLIIPAGSAIQIEIAETLCLLCS